MLRVAANSLFQGTASDLIKMAMFRIHHTLSSQQLASRMLLQVHDDMVFEVAPGEESALRVLVKTEMEGAAALDVPLLVEMGVGRDWVAAKS